MRAAKAGAFLVVAAALAACSREEPVRIPGGIMVAEAAMAVDVFVDRAMASYQVVNLPSGATGTVRIDEKVNQSEHSSLGGRITVTGTVRGSVNTVDGSTSLALDAKQAIREYKFAASGVTYTVNGAPDVAASGTLAMTGEKGGVSATLKVTGAFTIARSGVSRTCPVSVDVETAATGGVMRGTVCGETVKRSM